MVIKPIEQHSNISKWIYQVLATVVANLCTLSHGCNIGWASPSIPILMSLDSPMSSGPITVDEAAWVVSLQPIAAILGAISFGTLANYIGSRRSLLLCAFPSVICWSITWIGSLPWHLFVARVASGLTGGGVFTTVTMFVAEIASENVRGRLTSMLQLFFNMGIMLGYVAGSTLEYRTVPPVVLVVPIAFFCTFVWLPNSPQYLVKHHQLTEAETSLRFYRNCPENDKDEQLLREELNKFITIAQQTADMPSIMLSDFLSSEALRGLMIGPTLMAITQFSGSFVMTNYAALIFSETGSSMNANLSSIILGCIQVLGTLFASALIDRIGRKLLLLISCAGSAMCLLITGLYAYLSTHEYDVSSWNALPIISLSTFIFVSAIGLTPVPYVVMSEVMPQKIRRVGPMIGVVSVCTFAFIMLRIFPILLGALELYGCLWTFACVSSFGFFFTLIVVRETKGLNLDQIIVAQKKG